MAVSAMLTLYIMFTALSYLAGNVQLTHTELIVRIVKIAIVSALLSTEYSWSFFNDYLFVYFIGGVEQILQMIVEAGATGPGSPWYSGNDDCTANSFQAILTAFCRCAGMDIYHFIYRSSLFCDHDFL